MIAKLGRTVIEQGPEAARRFKDTMGKVLRVSKDELNRREADYQESRRPRLARTPKHTER